MPLVPVVARSNARAVMDQIVTLIGNGEAVPGDRLPSERDMAEQCGVSRTCVREALSALTLLGVLEVRPGEGAFVGCLDAAPLMSALAPLLLPGKGTERDLLFFRRLIECEGARLAARRCDAAALRAMREAVDGMRRALAAGDGPAGSQADLAFHMAMLSGAGNRILALAAACAASLMSHSVSLSRERLLADPSAATRLLEQHEDLLRSIEEGREGDAARKAEAHLDQVLDQLDRSGG